MSTGTAWGAIRGAIGDEVSWTSADAGGQMLGYVFGAGRTRIRLTRLEFHRYRFARAIGSNRDEYARP